MTHQRLTLIVLLSGLCLSACLDTSGLDEPVGQHEHKQIMLNQLPLQSILLNSLIGNEPTLTHLSTKPLHSDTFDVSLVGDELSRQLLDDNAKVFMKYLVRCALGREDPKLTWDHPLNTAGPQSWAGELGLCSAWATQEPTSECLQLVSACMLATENAVGKSVAISQRGVGLDGDAIPLESKVKVKTLDDDGDMIASFGACPTATSGADRDCGWSASASFVGVCTPGVYVALQCNVGSPHGVVRVCDGHTGCNHGDTTKLRAQADMCDTNQQLVFQCPEEGSYAVMAGPTQSGVPVALDLQASSGQFPAPELAVFDRREGAYFGSLLDPSSYHPAVSAHVDAAGVVQYDVPNLPTASLVVNQSMYACHDIDWQDAHAYATHRLCARVSDPGGDTVTLCAAHPLGACYGLGAAICAVDDNAVVIGDGDFDECTDGFGLWDNPITVFLDHPCDLASAQLENDRACPGLDPQQP